MYTLKLGHFVHSSSTVLSCQVTVGEGTVHPGQVNSSSQGCYVFGLWEEAGVSRQNPHRQRESIKTPCGKGPQLGLKPTALL